LTKILVPHTRQKAEPLLAFIYNTVGIPFATLGFLSPAIAGGAMAFSSVSVVTDVLRSRRFRPETAR